MPNFQGIYAALAISGAVGPSSEHHLTGHVTLSCSLLFSPLSYPFTPLIPTTTAEQQNPSRTNSVQVEPPFGNAFGPLTWSGRCTIPSQSLPGLCNALVRLWRSAETQARARPLFGRSLCRRCEAKTTPPASRDLLRHWPTGELHPWLDSAFVVTSAVSSGPPQVASLFLPFLVSPSRLPVHLFLASPS
jgi:hypothetical protein